jgi:hypothetical protein
MMAIAASSFFVPTKIRPKAKAANADTSTLKL